MRKPIRLTVQTLEQRDVPAILIDPIPDVTLTSNQDMAQVPVVAVDSEGDPVTLAVATAGSAAYFLDQDLGLVNGKRPTNWGGFDEKWFKGGDDYYFIKPSGEFLLWDGTEQQATGTTIAQLSPAYHQYPDLLMKATDGDFISVLDDRLGLKATATPARDTLGLDEVWFVGSKKAKFYLTPNGDLFRASGKPLGSDTTLVAHLDPVYHANPKMLTAATPKTLSAELTGTVLTIGEISGAAGEFAVRVSATDGTDTASQIIGVRVQNLAAPVVPQVTSQLLGVGETKLRLSLAATDADGDALTYTARPAGSAASVLAGDLELSKAKRKTNWGGDNEKWFEGRDGFYFLRPSGDLHHWDGTDRQASGEFIATLQPAYYHLPQLLTGGKREDLPYLLDRELGLSPTSEPEQGSLGLNERWLKGKKSDLFITPVGGLYLQGKDAVLLANLSPIFYEDLDRLYAAQPDRFTATVENGELVVDTKDGYFGDFVVEVGISDGVNSTSRLIPVEQRYIPITTGDDPRVVSAISPSNKTVIVTFNNPMNSSALEPLNYGIIQANVNSEAGTLVITGVRFINENRDAVELTTLSQTALLYTLSVVNVRDLANRQLAPREVSNGVVNDPSKSDFAGSGPTSADLTDSDGDGLLDDQEQRGWEVDVELINSGHILRGVSSDPYDPDTDDDGLSDYQEANLRLDARDVDTDDDQLTDAQEFNEIYSNGADQDSDDDTLDDSLEFEYFRSNPNDVDTDGDQLPDSLEVILGNRNLRVADLPKPAIEIGEAKMQLDIVFTATSSRGSRELDSKNVTSTLTQTDSKTTGREDSASHEFATSASTTNEWSVKLGEEGVGYEGGFTFEAGYTGTWSSTFNQESMAETARETAKSFTTDVESSLDETVVREVRGAGMAVAVSLQSLSNVAFTIKNVQVTAFMADPANPGALLPIATLLPAAGVPNEFNLGPLVPERGPFVFENDQIFPSLVEKLMLNPKGLVFKISNYDIVDERERNFSFSSQEINDRTAPLTIDFGGGDSPKGNTERYQVATSGGREIDVDGEIRRVLFDPVTGRAVGITVGDALERVVGLRHYDEDATPASTLTLAERNASYSTRIVDGVERLWRIRGTSSDLTNAIRGWMVFGREGIVGTTPNGGPAQDFRSLILEPDGGLTVAFLQDLDDDGIEASMEAKLGSSDTAVDSDGDSLSDFFEFVGEDPQSPSAWRVDVVGQPTRFVYSSPARADTDGDGLTDLEEYNRTIIVNGFTVPARTDPTSADSDGDGVTDFDEVRGFTVQLRFPENGVNLVFVFTNPLDADTDNDTLIDGTERRLGVNPTKNDGNRVFDDDNDGLVNFVETDVGVEVTVYGVSPAVGQQGDVSTVTRFSSPTDADSDNDGLADAEEYALGLRADAADTDGDGATDLEEVTVTVAGDGTRTIDFLYDPTDADADDDRRSDGAELHDAIVVRVFGQPDDEQLSDPLDPDADADGLGDFDEAFYGTNPNAKDSDGDNPSVGDAREIALGTNPLRQDKKVRVSVSKTRLAAAGPITDGGVGQDDAAEISGRVELGNVGNPELAKVYDTQSFTANQEDFYSLMFEAVIDAATNNQVILRHVGFREIDPPGNPDEFFTNAEVVFGFDTALGSGVLASTGQVPSTIENLTIETTYNLSLVV